MPSRKFDFKFVFEYLYVLNVFIDSNATVHLSVGLILKFKFVCVFTVTISVRHIQEIHKKT